MIVSRPDDGKPPGAPYLRERRAITRYANAHCCQATERGPVRARLTGFFCRATLAVWSRPPDQDDGGTNATLTLQKSDSLPLFGAGGVPDARLERIRRNLGNGLLAGHARSGTYFVSALVQSGHRGPALDL